MADLTAAPLGPSGGVNWVFLVELLICGVLALFFLFYFNRLFATLVSYAVRAWTWHQYRAYIDISALQISLLGGRVFFKSIRYHAHNETVLVHDGHITWRYWLRQVQDAEIFEEAETDTKGRRTSSASSSPEERKSSADEKGKSRSRSIGRAEKGGKQRKELPCRISVKVSGVEAFLYNQSPVYDGILKAAMNRSQDAPKPEPEHTKTEGQDNPPGSSSSESHVKDEKGRGLHKSGTENTMASTQPFDKPAIPSWLRILPIKIECKKAAAAVGNEYTTSIITAKLDNAAGTIDAGAAGPLDLFKLLFNFDFKNINVAMKPNRDFKQLQLDAAQRVLRQQEMQPETITQDGLSSFTSWWRKMRSLFGFQRRPAGSVRTASFASDPKAPLDGLDNDQIPGQAQWLGLTRYLDDNEMDEHDEWRGVEYAKSSSLAEVEQVSMRFYWDIPGKVQENGTIDNDVLLANEYEEDMNGSKPPDYGLDLAVHGGTIVYGPWTDRQRINLQNNFFPPSYVDATPATRLKPGDARVNNSFKLFLSIEKDVTLRIPAREESKDHRWRGRSNRKPTTPNQAGDSNKSRRKHSKKQKSKRQKGQRSGNAADARPYGWLDVTVKADSTISYSMDMLARHDGYRNNLSLDVKGTEITSSVNHGLLWRAAGLTLEADISNPISWNNLRHWPFKIVCNDMELFILRDHMFLIIDLVNDWASGPPPQFFTFIPFRYLLDMTLRNFTIYLNTNDANIINDPADFDRNEFLTIEGQELHAVLGIPLISFRPKENEITFDVIVQGMSMRLLNSPRNTLKVLLQDKKIAELPRLTLNGSFCGNQESGPGLTDILRMDIFGTGLTLKAYGFLLRHFINVKENYFGDYLHFKTLEEFQSSGDTLDEANTNTASLPKPQTANEMDVILCLGVEQGTVLLPTNLYSADEFVRLDLAAAWIDLRITSYYLDLGLNVSPISILTGSSGKSGESPVESASGTQLYIEHVDLNGHRAFGHPPDEAAYADNWDVDVGAITGECKKSFIRDIALAGKALAFTFTDGENVLPVDTPMDIFNATFLQLRTDIIRVWVHVGKEALLLSTRPVSVEFNDWASEAFSQRVSVLVPDLTFACVDSRSAARHRTREFRRQPVRTYAFFQTSISLNVVGRKLHFKEETKKQQAHIRKNDTRTHRTPFLLRESIKTSAEGVEDPEVDPPAIPVPRLPWPIDRNSAITSRPASIRSVRSFVSNKTIRSRSSKASLANSVKGQRLAMSRQGHSQIGSSSRQSSSSSGSSQKTPSHLSGVRANVLSNDRERAVFGLPPSTMAFSSSYAEPYFPLDMVEPDEQNVPLFRAIPYVESTPSNDSSSGDLIQRPEIERESTHTTVFVKLVPGIRAYFEPRIAFVAAKLVKELQPKTTEEVMDDYQMNVLSTITAKQQDRLGQGGTVEVSIDLPDARLRLAVPREAEQITDTLDVSLESLDLTLRLQKAPATQGRTESVAVHTLLDSLSLSLHHGQDSSNPSIADVRIDDVLFWAALADSQAGHVSVRDVSINARSDESAHIMALALHLMPMAKRLIEKFGTPTLLARKRLQLMMYTLIQHGEHIGDPTFMSRMTYILRAYTDHYRNQESWKVIMRFRHTLQCLPVDVLRDLNTQFKFKDIACPDDAPYKVMQAWSQWRNWDVPNIGRTLAFQLLFDEDDREEFTDTTPKSISLTWNTESLKLQIDAGRQASIVSFGSIGLGLDVTPPSTPQGLMLVEENKRTKTLLQLHTASANFSFDWKLVDAVESLIPGISALSVPDVEQSEGQSPPPTQEPEEGFIRHDFHIVFSSDLSILALQTINLRHKAQAEGLRMSLIGSTQASDTYGECVSAVINADTALTELYSESARIWQTILSSPCLYIDHLRPLQGTDSPPTVQLAMSYDELQIHVHEQLPGILHTIDTVILSEAKKIANLVKMIQKAQPAQTSQEVIPAPRQTDSPIKVRVAVLAGKLLIDFSLLQALSYRIQGTAVSLRVAPNLIKKDDLAIDFEVGRQSHLLINHTGDDDHQQGILDVPPINGRVGLEFGHSATEVAVNTSIEQIEVDAGAIQSIASVLSKPEVQDVIGAIKHAVEDISHHVDEEFPKAAQTQELAPAPGSKTLVYDARIALLGVRVSASTPQIVGHSTAELEFGIGPVHIKSSNRVTPGKSQVSLFPQITAHVQDIGAKLAVRQKQSEMPAGNVTLSIMVQLAVTEGSDGKTIRELSIRSEQFEINAYPQTAAIIVDVINHLQDRLKDLDMSKEVDYLRRMRDHRKNRVMRSLRQRPEIEQQDESEATGFTASDLLGMKVTVDLRQIQATWLVDQSYAAKPTLHTEDLVLSLSHIELSAPGGNEARLTIKDLQLQLVPKRKSKQTRTLNSALLPEVGFSVAYWSKGRDKSLAFKASGKPLDLRLETRFVIPVKGVQRSIEDALEKFRTGTANWQSMPTSTGRPRAQLLGKNHFASLLLEADFAGAQVHLQRAPGNQGSVSSTAAERQERSAPHGRYGQFATEGGNMHTSLKAPGISLKLEYNDSGYQPIVNGELRVDASSNMLLPNVVPLLLEISNSVKEVVQNPDDTVPSTPTVRSESVAPQRFFEDESIVKADPAAFFGKTKVNLGLRVCKQEFGLTCQPIAKVDAKAELGDFYFTVNTIESEEQGHFFAMSAVLTTLSTKVKHVYSREPTFSFEMDSIVLSLMNSKHLSGVNGISAILKINPTKTAINGKQLQDLLLFREIWLPPEIRSAPASAPAPQANHGEDYLVQRYQSVAAATAFPWNATVSIAELAVDLDLGQSIGKSSFTIKNLWASSQKSSSWEQNLCVGLDDMAMTSQGRMSGFIQLNQLQVRTSIKWPEDAKTARKTPFIQASIGFRRLRAKASFDYQAFAFGDIEGFDFLMYNVRATEGGSRDRLVAVLDCEKAYVFCTSTSPAQAFGLYQAFDRLIQEKQAAFKQSLKEIEKHVRRESISVPTRFGPQVPDSPVKLRRADSNAIISLHTDVVVTIGAISVGAFPSTFFDSQILKLEANNIQARFAVGLEKGKIHSGLGMTLGQLQVALATVKRVSVPKTLGDISVDEVISSAVNSKGGIILRVPKVVASMQTWQAPDSNSVQYIFKSLFEGKIDVGWNLSRINFIKGMWVTHSRALAGRLGKPLPESSVKIRAGPQNEEGEVPTEEGQQQKITAEVNLPQSRYEYIALEPPIIETPQLRDMGEATPPLEWIGLHRDRLPNVTHQIIIVSLLEVAKEVEDAYDRILGSS